MKKNKQGFTLVELMVVAIIVAILAAVAIPLMSANKVRAKATEAEAALGTIRTALRAMYAETSAYDEDLNGDDIADGSAPTALPGIGVGDLEGRYFFESDYELTTLDTTTYTITASGSTGDLVGVTITLDEKGAFVRTGL